MKFFTSFSLILLCVYANAQAKFVTEGKIFFEKRINQFKSFESDEKESESDWFKNLKKNYPKMLTDNYVLIFNQKKSLFKLYEENLDNKYLWNSKPSDIDLCIQNLETKTTQTVREVFEETYLIQDSLRQIEWKYLDETREIIGFNCKKAVGKICDSVYIVAFYCDEILCNAGPETFGGLPGMILGLAVPRLGTTYFATKLETIYATSIELNFPKPKGKKTNWKNLNKDMIEALEDWGKSGKFNMWRFNL